MKKKILTSLLMGAFLFASTSVVTSCKDYDDDINNLQTQIDNLQKIVGDINAAIGKGYYLTDVKPIANGVEIFTSNGGDFKITNGADGKDGKDGVDGKDGKDGTTWTIGDDGYWYQNGTKTNYKAIGQDGKDGKDGLNGKDGKDGKDGLNGKDGKDGKDGVDGLNGKDGKDGKDGLNGKDGKDGKDGVDGLNGKDGKNGKDGVDGQNGDYYVPNAETGKFDRYTYNTTTKQYEKDATEAEEDKISFLAPGTITAVMDNDYLKLFNVEGAETDPIVIALFTHLKSLVFSPKFYYEGIEAFDFATYNFKSWTVKAVSADGDFSTDKPEQGAEVTYAPDLAATYFLNPSNAKMSAEAENYKFIGFNRNYTRAGEDVINKAFKVTKADLETKGEVTVHAQYDGNVIKSIAADKQVTVLALQYTQGDTIITSDFAAIQANAYKGLVLNHLKEVVSEGTSGRLAPAKDPEEVHDHLYRSAAEAIANLPMDSVVWNDEDGIDLRELVNTHRYDEEGKEDHAWDENAADTESELAQSGFTYEFELVGYVDGSNKTSQSAHANIKDGYILRPQMTKDGKQQEWGYDQNQATIGRMPLVRVLLKMGDKIADVGYLKLKIVATKEEPTKPEAESYEIPTFAEPDYVLNCGDENVLDKKLVWHEVEEPIYAHEKISLSKEDFEKYYKLDMKEGVAKQFGEAVIDAEELATPIGEIKQTTTDVAGTMTEILSWTVKNQQAYTLVKGTKEGETPTEPIFTYIRFVKQDGAPSDKPAQFYVKFTWSPKVYTNPTSAFTNESKIKQIWYANNDPVAGSGYENIHGNVPTVGTGNVKDFVVPLTYAIVGNNLHVDKIAAPYEKLNENLHVTANFIDGNGLYANANGTELHNVVKAEQTQETLVATIDPETGNVTYADTDVAKELLNKVGHRDLANSVTAKIAMKAVACENEGNYEIPVTNNSFDLKFLRPITITSATAEFTDAETAGSEHDIQMSFIDWREHDFVAEKDAEARKGYNYFEFYGVESITVDTESDEATTNINGKVQKLNEVTKELKFSFTPATADEIKEGKFGKLKFVNGKLTLGGFYIDYPMTVTYAWGTIKGTLRCNFKKTIQNAKRF